MSSHVTKALDDAPMVPLPKGALLPTPSAKTVLFHSKNHEFDR